MAVSTYRVDAPVGSRERNESGMKAAAMRSIKAAALDGPEDLRAKHPAALRVQHGPQAWGRMLVVVSPHAVAELARATVQRRPHRDQQKED